MSNAKSSAALLVAALAAISIGCQKSPLLNHANAEDRHEKLEDKGQSSNNAAPASSTLPANPSDGSSPLPANPGDGSNETGTTEEAQTCPLSFKQQGLCASLTWIKTPSEDENGEFIVRFWKASDGTAQSGPFVDPSYTVGAKLFMPSMGHGSSPVKVSRVKNENGDEIPGIYRVTDVYFSMQGKWEIWIQLKQDKKVIEQSKLDYDA